MLRILPSLTSTNTSTTTTHPPSTPLLEKGVVRSTSKRSKPGGVYYAHEIRAWKRYTRCLQVVIVVLVGWIVVGGGWWGGDGGREGSIMGGWGVGKGNGDGDGVVLAMVKGCGVVLEEREEGCLRRFGGDVAAAGSSSSSSGMMGRGEREAWREVKDGLEGLWRGLIESECKCHDPERLDRMYEGLRDRAGEMAGERGGVGGLDGKEVLEG